jgi:hypothetical protein
MNREETKAILAVLKAGYPNFYKEMTKEDATDIINLWSTMFASDPSAIVTEAVKSLMCTLKYPPTIADVKEKIMLITQPTQISEMEAWQIVKNAVDGYSIYDPENNKKIFNGLPETIQRILGSASTLREWGLVEIDTFNSVIQSNFMRSYRAVAAQEREKAMLPESTKQLISGLSEKLSISDGK